MRLYPVFIALFVCSLFVSGQTKPSAVPATPASTTVPLTVVVEGINHQDGNIGVLVFNSERGWPEDLHSALRDIVVTATPGTMTVNINDLPAGDYAVVVLHDANKNRKMDRNWLSKPQEQWGMSNNPHALIKAPAFLKARFSLKNPLTLHIQLQ